MKQSGLLIFILTFLGLALGLFFFTTIHKPKAQNVNSSTENNTQVFNIEAYTLKQWPNFNPQQQKKLTEYRKLIADNPKDLNTLNQLVSFSKDSLKDKNLYCFYLSKASLLDNSQKSLTFAARQLLNELQQEDSIPLRLWKTKESVELFEKAYQKDTTQNQLLVEQGKAYIYGYGMAGDAENTMVGVQKLRGLLAKDTTNSEVEFLLGVGGVVSGQLDKAIPRLLKVANAQPNNLNALSWLAEAYASSGNKQQAIVWFNKLKQQSNNQAMKMEIEQRIKLLNKN